MVFRKWDVLFVFNRTNYKEYKKKLVNIRDISPVKIHDIVQTEEDLTENIKKKNTAVLDAFFSPVYGSVEQAVMIKEPVKTKAIDLALCRLI